MLKEKINIPKSIIVVSIAVNIMAIFFIVIFYTHFHLNIFIIFKNLN